MAVSEIHNFLCGPDRTYHFYAKPDPTPEKSPPIFRTDKFAAENTDNAPSSFLTDFGCIEDKVPGAGPVGLDADQIPFTELIASMAWIRIKLFRPRIRETC